MPTKRKTENQFIDSKSLKLKINEEKSNRNSLISAQKYNYLAKITKKILPYKLRFDLGNLNLIDHDLFNEVQAVVLDNYDKNGILKKDAKRATLEHLLYGYEATENRLINQNNNPSKLNKIDSIIDISTELNTCDDKKLIEKFRFYHQMESEVKKSDISEEIKSSKIVELINDNRGLLTSHREIGILGKIKQFCGSIANFFTGKNNYSKTESERSAEKILLKNGSNSFKFFEMGNKKHNNSNLEMIDIQAPAKH